jgi:hypothetical protein
MAAENVIPITTSPSDRRTYKFLQLNNGLRVVLIHDPEMGSGAAPANPAAQGGLRSDVDAGSSMSEGSDSEGSVSEDVRSALPRTRIVLL